jgi:hypothetical protein
MTDKMYIRQWVEVGGVLFAEIGFEPDETEIDEDSNSLNMSTFCFHAGWFDALFLEDLPAKIECNFIFDYLCGWYSQKHELEIASKHCHWEEF